MGDRFSKSYGLDLRLRINPIGNLRYKLIITRSHFLRHAETVCRLVSSRRNISLIRLSNRILVVISIYDIITLSNVNTLPIR